MYDLTYYIYIPLNTVDLGLPLGIFPLGFASKVSYPNVVPILELFSHYHFSLPNYISWSLSFTGLWRLLFRFIPAFPISHIFLVSVAIKFPIIPCFVSYIFLLPRCCSFGIFSKYFPQLTWLPNCRESVVEWSWRGKVEVLGEGLVPLPLYPLWIPHGLAQDRTWTSAVWGRQVHSHRSKLISQYCLQNLALHKQCR